MLVLGDDRLASPAQHFILVPGHLDLLWAGVAAVPLQQLHLQQSINSETIHPQGLFFFKKKRINVVIVRQNRGKLSSFVCQFLRYTVCMKIKRLRLEDPAYNIWYVLARRRWEVGVNTCVFVYGVYSVAITALEDTCVFETYARQLLPRSNTCSSLGCTSNS